MPNAEGDMVEVVLKRGVKAQLTVWDGGFLVKIVSHLSGEVLAEDWCSAENLVEFLLNHEDW